MATSRSIEIEIKGNASGASRAAKEAQGALDGLIGTIGTLKNATAAYLSFQAAQQVARQAMAVARVADEWQGLQTQIKQATRELGEYEKVSASLYRQAQANGVQLEGVVSLYRSIARTAPELKLTNDQLLAVTDTISKLGAIGRTSAEAMQAGLMQFGQGLAAGILRAEEWNSIVENIPELANAIAAGMGKTVGQMRQAVNAGSVLSKDVFAAIQKQAADVNQRFSELPLSLQMATNSLENSTKQFLGFLGEQYTSFLASRIKELSTAMDGVIAYQRAREDSQSEIDFRLGRERITERRATVQGQIVRLVEQANALPEAQRKAYLQSIQPTLNAYSQQIKQIDAELQNYIRRQTAGNDAVASGFVASGKSIAEVTQGLKLASEVTAQYKTRLEELRTAFKTAIDGASEKERADLIAKQAEAEAALLKQYQADMASFAVSGSKAIKDGLREAAEALREQQRIAEEAIEAVEDQNAALFEQSDAWVSLAAEHENVAALQILYERQLIQVTAALRAMGATEQEIAAARQRLWNEGPGRAAAEALREQERLATEAAEAARREWERTAEIIEDELTAAFIDAFENGGNLAKNLRDAIASLFNQLVLRPVVQAVMAPVAGSIASAGMDALGLANAGSSAYNAFSGGGIVGSAIGYGGTMAASLAGGAGFSQAAMLAAQTAEFGLAGATMTGTALGSSTLAATMASAGSVLIPLAVMAAASYLMNRPPDPMRGSVQSFVGQRGIGYNDPLAFNAFTRFQDDEEQGFEAVGNYASVFGRYQWNMQNGRMSEAEAQGFNEMMRGFGMMEQAIASMTFKSAKDLEEFTRNLGAVQNGTDEFNQIWRERIRDQMVDRFSRILTGIDADFSKILATFDQSSADKFAADLGKMINEFSAARAAVERTSGTLYDLSAAAVLAAQNIIQAAGGLESFNAGFAIFQDKFYTDADKLKIAQKQVGDFFSSLNLAVPSTRTAFKDLVESLSKELTPSAQEAYGKLIAASGSMDQFFSLLEGETGRLEAAAKQASDAWKKGIESMLASVGKLLDATKTLRENISGNLDEIMGVTRTVDLDALFRQIVAPLDTADQAEIQARLDLAGQYVSAVMDQYREQASAIQASIDAENARVDALKSAGKALAQWADDLRRSEASGLTPGLRLDVARDQYASLLAAARAGDLDSAQRLGASATDYLALARQSAGSAVDYRRIAGRVTAEMGGLGSALMSSEAQTARFQRELEDIQRQALERLTALDKSAGWLQDQLAEQQSALEKALDGVTDALKKLPDAMQKAIADGMKGSDFGGLVSVMQTLLDEGRVAFNQYLFPYLQDLMKSASAIAITSAVMLDEARIAFNQYLFPYLQTLITQSDTQNQTLQTTLDEGRIAFNQYLFPYLQTLIRHTEASAVTSQIILDEGRVAFNQYLFPYLQQIIAGIDRFNVAAMEILRVQGKVLETVNTIYAEGSIAFGHVFAAQKAAQDSLNSIYADGATAFGHVFGMLNSLSGNLASSTSSILAAIAAIYIPPCPPAPACNCSCGGGSVTLPEIDWNAPRPDRPGIDRLPPPFADGGIASGPRSGYLATLHGTEAVVPLPDGRSIPVDLGSGKLAEQIQALQAEIRELRLEQRRQHHESARYARDTADTLRAWDRIGQPAVREEA